MIHGKTPFVVGLGALPLRTVMFRLFDVALAQGAGVGWLHMPHNIPAGIYIYIYIYIIYIYNIRILCVYI